MSNLVRRLESRQDLVILIKKVRVVKLDYGWRFRKKEEGYIDVRCDKLRLRVNGFDVIDDSDEAYELLVREAKELKDYYKKDWEFKASYFGKRYKKFNPH